MGTGGVVVPAHLFPIAYCVCIGSGLLCCLFLAIRLHYETVVQTHCRNWEFWPSVSSCTGDHMPERAVWRIAIALGGGPRIISAVLQRHHFLEHLPGSGACDVAAGFWFDLVRIVAAGMWTYVSSGEHLLVHEVAFVVYVVAGFIAQAAQTSAAARAARACTSQPRLRSSFRAKAALLSVQVVAACGVGYFFVQHRRHCAPGGYSRSTVCEWIFSTANVLYDLTCAWDLRGVAFSIVARSASHDPAAAAQAGALRSAASAAVHSWGAAADTLAGYLFWTFMYWMPLQVYFLPMVRMAFTWHVGLILVPGLTAMLLCSSPRARPSRRGAALLLLASCVGLHAYDVRTWAEAKLGFAALGCTFATAAVFVRMTEPGAGAARSRERAQWGLAYGLTAHSIVRMLWAGQDPATTSGLFNGLLVLASVAAALLLWAEGSLAQSATEDGPCCEAKQPAGAAAPAPGGSSGGAAEGVSLGLLIFLAQLICSEHGIASRWVGLPPLPYGVVPLAAFAVGTVCGYAPGLSRCPPSSRAHAALGAAGLAGAALAVWASGGSRRMVERGPGDWPLDPPFPHGYYGSPHLAFLGSGLLLPAFVGLHWHGVLDRALSGPVAAGDSLGPPAQAQLRSTLGYVLLAWAVSVVASIYVVAFTFVPAGALLRDRVWVVVVGCTAALHLAARRSLPQQAPQQQAPQRAPGASDCAPRRATACCVAALLAIAAVSAYRGAVQTGIEEELAQYPETHATHVRAAIWTIHYGYDNHGNDNYDGLVHRLNASGSNVIGLLETDISRIPSGNRDFVEYASERLRMHSDFGPPTLDDTFGCGVLSKYPFVRVTRYVLPSPQGELACLIHAVISVGRGRLVHVYVSHFGNTEHPLDRKLQSQSLATLAKINPGPSIFLGYLTTRPGGENHRVIVNNETGWLDTGRELRYVPHNKTQKGHYFFQAGRHTEFDPADPAVFASRYCEYILYRGLPFFWWEMQGAGQLSDTELQIADFDIAQLAQPP
eukprot:TRINITY_DN31191_c0_g1_i1.p1 TRINITY_DN31191_c0_g1~~TRINITY_DN31191_c0_g1_i1.p1  ORF type:complete len:998 (+),score=284.46 TRINITY_DN31191_c0_g1_i1:107-3100(+)